MLTLEMKAKILDVLTCSCSDPGCRWSLEQGTQQLVKLVAGWHQYLVDRILEQLAWMGSQMA